MLVIRRTLSALGTRTASIIPKVGLVAGGVGLFLMTGLVVAGIISRRLFSYSIPFAIEYSEFLIPVIALWGAAYALKEGSHVRADIIIHRLSGTTKQWFILAGYLVGLPYLIILAIYTSKLAWTTIKMHYVSMYPTATPFGYAQLIIPIGLSLFAIQLIIEIIGQVRQKLTNYNMES